MTDILKARLVSIIATSMRHTTELRTEIVDMLDKTELDYLQVGAGRGEVYAILPDDRDLNRLEEIVHACDAIVSGSARLFVENFETPESESNWAERMLKNSPINYDIPQEEFRDALLGICGKCAGVGRHVGPPCLQETTNE